MAPPTSTLSPSDWPSVTVIVLNHNGRPHLQECLPSLLNLDYPAGRLEILVADNGSRDDSVAYASSFGSRVNVLSGEKNLGFAAGNNWAARSARGDYLAFLNNDMRVDRLWLKELVRALHPESGTVCVTGKILSWDGKHIDFNGGALNFYGMAFQPGHGQQESESGSEPPGDTLFPCGGSMLINARVFLQVGGFDEDYFAYFEDVDLGWRLWVMGYRIRFSPQAVSYHRYQGTSRHLPDERRLLLYERNALFSVIKNYGDDSLTRVLPAALLLTAHRGFLALGEDRRQFLMPAQGGWPIESPGPAGSGPASALFSVSRPGFSRARLLGLWREKGSRGIIGALLIKAAHWLQPALPTPPAPPGHPNSGVLVPRRSLSSLVALDEVARHFSRLWEKRLAVQSQRKRPDDEIFPLFGAPCHPHPPFPEFFSIQEQLSLSFRINGLFPERDLGKRAFDLPF
jgi:GT2 family glycosyltransferase